MAPTLLSRPAPAGGLLALLALTVLLGGAPARGDDAERDDAAPGIHNPYYERTEWKVWRDDPSPVADVTSLVREGKETKPATVTLTAPVAAERVFPLDPPPPASGKPYVVFEKRATPSDRHAGIWDDVYSSWSGLHGYVRPDWKGADGSAVVVRGRIIDFVDVKQDAMMRAGVNFVHQSTTGMGHAITNGVIPARTLGFEKLYFADVLVTAPAHASLTDHAADRTSDLFLAHVPTLFNSVGSSNSETMAITKLVIVGGYLPPDVKLELKRNGAYPGALLSIWKAALPYDVPYDHELRQRVAYKAVGDRAAYPETYGAAGIDRGDMALPYHQYDDGAHMRAMVDLACSMDVAPPEAVFSVIRVEGGKEAYALRKSALVLQAPGEEVRVRVSSAGCYDLQDLPLTTRWTLLYGNPRTRVERDPDDPATCSITVPWDDALPGGRTAIALVAHNGRFPSNPAIVSVYRQKEDLPGPGLGPGDYAFAGTHANRRPVLLDLQDRVVRRGKRIEIPLRAVDPEGFPVSFFRRAGEVGEIDGDLLTWDCPRKEPKGEHALTVIASDGTSGNGYAGKTIRIHVEKPALLAQITAAPLTGAAPLTVKVTAKDSVVPRGKVAYGWSFHAPGLGRKAPPFEQLTQGREAEHVFDEPGVYEIELTVRAGKETDTETVGVWVTAEAPGTAAAPASAGAALAVRWQGVDIGDGDEAPCAFDRTDFGPVRLGDEVDQEFCLLAVGGDGLRFPGKGAVHVVGEHAEDFEVVRQPRARLEAGGSSRFAIRFRPRGVGIRTATVQVPHGAAAFTFAIQGEGRASAPR